MATPIVHFPVLLAEVLEHLPVPPRGRVLDLTLGLGGHAEAILAQAGTEVRYLGVDRDPHAREKAQHRLGSDARLNILAEHKLGLPDIQKVICELGPMPGAREFLDQLREDYEVIILSDTFYEFAHPLMRQLDWPTLFCHSLEADASGMLVAYHLRMPDQKREAVQRFKELKLKVVAAGDSYNDTAMLGEAHGGILFHPPANVIREFPQYPVVLNYDDLRTEIDKAFLVASR